MEREPVTSPSAPDAEAPPRGPTFDEAFAVDPYPMLAVARAAGAYEDVASGCRWATRYADVDAVLRGPSGKDPARAVAGPYTQAVTHMRGTLMFMDPPDHARLRALVSGAFPPRVIEALRPRMTAIAADLAAPLASAAELELMSAFARPFSAYVIAEIIGVAAADRDAFLAWSDDMAHSFDPFRTPEVDARIARAYADFRTYIAEIITARRAAPRQDLTSRLIAARDGSDRLSDDEMIKILAEIVDAGTLTTADAIGNGMVALLDHPAQLAALRADPALLPNAVEEVLRFDTSIVTTERVAAAGTSIAGNAVPTGAWVMPCVAAANRDPAVFPEPDRFEVTRANADQHLTFGGGRHVCLGAALARVEVEVAIAALLRAFPVLRLDASPAQRKTIPGFRGFAAIRLHTS